MSIKVSQIPWKMRGSKSKIIQKRKHKIPKKNWTFSMRDVICIWTHLLLVGMLRIKPTCNFHAQKSCAAGTILDRNCCHCPSTQWGKTQSGDLPVPFASIVFFTRFLLRGYFLYNSVRKMFCWTTSIRKHALAFSFFNWFNCSIYQLFTKDGGVICPTNHISSIQLMRRISLTQVGQFHFLKIL